MTPQTEIEAKETTAQAEPDASPSPVPAPEMWSSAAVSREPPAARERRFAQARSSPFGTLWFVWMVVMWVAFFVLLFADRLDAVWNAIRQLPIVVEIVLWIAFLPWMLGMAVWTSSWAGWLRAFLVICFAAGWTLASVPRVMKRAD